MDYSLELYEKIREVTLVDASGSRYGKAALLQQGMLAWLRIVHFDAEPSHALKSSRQIEERDHQQSVNTSLIDLLANIFFSMKPAGASV
jgi:hypothetical protein